MLVRNEGSLFLFTCLTPAADDWVAANADVPDYMRFGTAFACEPRYAGELAAAMIDAGLTVK